MITDGHLLGGRVKFRQPAVGFRSGLEPVLLAAATPAVAGDHVVEAGTGAGAALLCLNARVRGLHCLGIEIDPDLVGLAADNASANGFDDMRVTAGRLETVEPRRMFDHAMANPPYHAGDGTASPVAAREIAKRGSATLIETWIRRLAVLLRDGGSLTLTVPIAIIPLCLSAMSENRCACNVIFPLWPMAGRPAKLALIRGRRLSRAPLRLASGLVLHRPDGSFTDAAQAVLRDGAALSLG